jgi:hypothetical protein
MRMAPGLAFVVAVTGLGLLAWLVYDASSVVSALGLSGILSEAAVALSVLALVGLCWGGAIVLVRRTPAAARAAKP